MRPCQCLLKAVGGADRHSFSLTQVKVARAAQIVPRVLFSSPCSASLGAFLATWIGQAIGWYRPDQGAGFIAAIIGSVLVLFIWNRLVAAHVISDPGAGPRN